MACHHGPGGPFEPCSPLCPAVTGKPHGSLQYCPMHDPERHRASAEHAPDVYRKVQGGPFYQRDWRTGEEVEVAWVEAPDQPGWGTFAPASGPIPLHPDYADCCADFRCCSDRWAKAGLKDVLTVLVGAVEAGGGVVGVVVGHMGAGVVGSRGPEGEA